MYVCGFFVINIKIKKEKEKRATHVMSRTCMTSVELAQLQIKRTRECEGKKKKKKKKNPQYCFICLKGKEMNLMDDWFLCSVFENFVPSHACVKTAEKCEVLPFDMSNSVCEWGKDLVHAASVNRKWRQLIFNNAKRLFSTASIRIARETKIALLYDLLNNMKMPCTLCLFGHLHVGVGVYALNMLMKHRYKFSEVAHVSLHTAGFDITEEGMYVRPICKYIKDMQECQKVTWIVTTHGSTDVKKDILFFEKRMRNTIPDVRWVSIVSIEERKRTAEVMHRQKNKRQKC